VTRNAVLISAHQTAHKGGSKYQDERQAPDSSFGQRPPAGNPGGDPEQRNYGQNQGWNKQERQQDVP
jgi:hypothetical protein